MHQTKRIGDRVIDIAALCGLVAIGEPARHVAAPHEHVQRCRRAVTRLRCDPVARMDRRPNEIWHLQSQLTNFFYPQQKLISKVRDGAKVTKKYDTATTPFHRAINHADTTVDRIAALARTHALINPAATQRQIQALTTQLHKMTTSKSQPATRTRIPKRAQSHEATEPPSRAS